MPASLAADVPVFIATPTSAWASAGASLVPSPVIATSRPPSCSLLDQRELVLGRGLGEEVVHPGLVGDRLGGQRVVAGDHHGADAHPAHLVEALAHALLDDVLEVDDAERPGRLPVDVLGDHQRGAAGARRSRRRSAPTSSVGCPPLSRTHFITAVAAPLRTCRTAPSSVRSTPDIRVCAVNGDERRRAAARPASRSRRPYRSLASTTIERPSGVSSARLDSCAASASSLAGDAVDGQELGGLPVAQGDGAGLVQQQRVDVAGRLDRPAAHRQHVALHQPVHAGDADRRQQRADRGRDQADQQRDQHDAGDAVAGRARACPGAAACYALE